LVEIFEKMQVPYHRLMPTRPFFGGNRGVYNANWAGKPARHLRHPGQL
jgi:hypothetical protein